jgi:hypothetical protein
LSTLCTSLMNFAISTGLCDQNERFIEKVSSEINLSDRKFCRAGKLLRVRIVCESFEHCTTVNIHGPIP